MALLMTDSDLPWSRLELRAHFRARSPLVAEHGQPPPERTEAAVLVPLVAHAHTTTVLLTRRTDHLHHHAGQISFPGGRRDPGDASPIQTALRETQEEVGLDPGRIEILGSLSPLQTPSGFHITPIVGLLEAPLAVALDHFEVAEAFEVPLAFVSDLGNYQRHRIKFQGVEREFFAVPCGGRFIWGATAAVLAMLAEFLADQRR